jgi:hypothetical protein
MVDGQFGVLLVTGEDRRRAQEIGVKSICLGRASISDFYGLALTSFSC